MDKRVSSRGIIIEDGYYYAMFRRRTNDNGEVREYYVIPGGGIDEGESLEDNVKRELKEEFCVDVKVLDYLGKDESETTIAHFFKCEIINGTPKLGGEELEKQCESNYYEVKKVSINDLEMLEEPSREMVLKAYNSKN